MMPDGPTKPAGPQEAGSECFGVTEKACMLRVGSRNTAVCSAQHRTWMHGRGPVRIAALAAKPSDLDPSKTRKCFGTVVDKNPDTRRPTTCIPNLSVRTRILLPPSPSPSHAVQGQKRPNRNANSHNDRAGVCQLIGVSTPCSTPRFTRNIPRLTECLRPTQTVLWQAVRNRYA